MWRNLGPKGQVGLVGSALLVLVTFFMLFHIAGKKSYSAVVTGMNPTDSLATTKALDKAGVKYRLVNGGTEIDVVQGQEDAARAALAQGGLPSGGHVGFEIFDKTNMGQTSFQQNVQYQRALEGQIARTIEGIQGISGAQVQLVMPQDSLFASQGTKASAAVMLTGGSSLDPQTVRGIAHLVASSVKDLSVQDVTITDETGALLWPTADAMSGGGPGVNTKLQAEQTYDSRLSAQLNAMLATTLGPGKAEVRVHTDLNVDTGTVDKVVYDKKNAVAQSVQRDDERLRSNGGGAPGGAAGVTANTPQTNVPSYAQTAGNGTSNYNHVQGTTQYAIGKEISHVDVAPGKVNRLDVALMVDSSIPAAQLASLQKTLSAAAGLVPARGDTLAVSQIKFAAPTTTAPAAKGLPIPAALLGPAKYLGIFLALGLFLLMMRRNLRRKERDGVAVEPTWLREIEQAVPIAQLEQSMAANRVVDPSMRQREQLREEFEKLVKNQPEQVALQVNAWIKEG
jgi:flagellar M-ring protein FliF